jgi:uncharacterized membrane protein YfcA
VIAVATFAGFRVADLAVVAGAVFFAAMIQVMSGFGFGLLSVPLMALAIPTRDAVVISTLVGVCVSSWQAVHGWSHRDRARVKRLTIAAYVGMPLGLWVFVAVDDHVLRLLLGIAVLFAVTLLALRVDIGRAGPGLEVGCGFVSGVLNTSLSTNGPPLAFVLQARRLEPDAFRATIAAVFMFSNIAGVSLFVAAGKVHAHGLLGAAIAVPTMFLGQLVGYPLRRHVHGERFRVLVLGLLTMAAASAIFAALR